MSARKQVKTWQLCTEAFVYQRSSAAARLRAVLQTVLECCALFLVHLLFSVLRFPQDDTRQAALLRFVRSSAGLVTKLLVKAGR